MLKEETRRAHGLDVGAFGAASTVEKATIVVREWGVERITMRICSESWEGTAGDADCKSVFSAEIENSEQCSLRWNSSPSLDVEYRRNEVWKGCDIECGRVNVRIERRTWEKP